MAESGDHVYAFPFSLKLFSYLLELVFSRCILLSSTLTSALTVSRKIINLRHGGNLEFVRKCDLEKNNFHQNIKPERLTRLLAIVQRNSTIVRNRTDRANFLQDACKKEKKSTAVEVVEGISRSRL